MFLDRLNADQKNSFMALATRIVMADGDVAPEEEAMLNDLRGEMGEGVKAPPEEIFGATNADVFDTREVRIIAALEVFAMAYSDEKLHIDESSVIKEICGALGIDDAEKEKLTDWAQRLAALGETPSSDAEAALRAEAEAMITG